MAYHGYMTTTHTTAATMDAPAVVEGHRVKCLEQIPNRNRNRYPTTGQWTCECGEKGRVRAPWGSQVDASLAAHRRHAEAAAADSLMVEPESHSCDECGANSGQPCEWSCTSRPEEPDSSPVLVRAIVRSPAGQEYVTYGGVVPAWLWDDARTRNLWKRHQRPYVLCTFTADPEHARGFRVRWEAFEEVPPS